MNEQAVAWLIPAFIIGFAAFWCLISKVLSLMAWHRLAAYYASPAPVLTPNRFRLRRAKLGLVSYNGVIQAGIAPEGLALSVAFPFRVGHPPLLIPWSALEPVQTRKFLWSTYYTTAVQFGDGRLKFQFSDQRLVQAVQPWLRVA